MREEGSCGGWCLGGRWADIAAVANNYVSISPQTQTQTQPTQLVTQTAVYRYNSTLHPSLLSFQHNTMPRIRTSRTKPPPEGFEDIQWVLPLNTHPLTTRR